MDRILIIDDEKSVLDMLNVIFKKEGYRVKKSLSAQKALELIDEEDFDLILSDIRLPQISGMELLRKVKEKKPGIPVIMITAYGTIKQAVEAFKAGAIDYVVKPFDVEELKIIVSQGLEKIKLKEENILLKKELKEKYSFKNMVGKSKKMKEIYSLIEKLAATDSTVLITGESGTGKEMAARAVHLLSQRGDNRFVSLNCGALPENLLESELFGHVKGSFTGAVVDKKGMFEVAEKGVLFLDEVGEMSPWTQVKLLGAIQDKKVRRVGGTEEIPVDVRIIAATNQNLKKRIEEEKFREDLFYRLNVIHIDVPPLRERIEDLPSLAQHFLEKYAGEMGKSIHKLSSYALDMLSRYDFPGNARELENMIERSVAMATTNIILPESLALSTYKRGKKSAKKYELMDFDIPTTGLDLDAVLADAERGYLLKALEMTQGVKQKAAKLLGISFRSFRYRLQKLGLEKD